MDFLLVQVLNSISYGLLLFMLASGLTLVFSLMGVLNFAHASFYMLGAYFAYQISRWIGFWPALVLAPLTVGALGVAVERFALRRAHRYGHVAELLFTFGLAYLIEEATHLVWGRSAVPYRVPPDLDGPLFSIMGTQYPMYRGFMMLVAVAILVSIWLVLKKTRIGLVIQAALTHPQTVEALGHNVPRVFMLVCGGGVALAGLAGVIGGNAFITEPGMAAALGPIVFVIVVDVAKEVLPGTAEIRKGYMYGTHRPGLGIDINEDLAAKYPITEARNGGAYGTDRSLDGTVIIP